MRSTSFSLVFIMCNFSCVVFFNARNAVYARPIIFSQNGRFFRNVRHNDISIRNVLDLGFAVKLHKLYVVVVFVCIIIDWFSFLFWFISFHLLQKRKTE